MRLLWNIRQGIDDFARGVERRGSWRLNEDKVLTSNYIKEYEFFQTVFKKETA
jgi:hypothetical protein